MQKEGTPRFLRHHSQPVKGVAFSPRDRYLFASGGADGKVSLNMIDLSVVFAILINGSISFDRLTCTRQQQLVVMNYLLGTN